MSRVVTIGISDAAARQAQATASVSARRVEDVLSEWIDRLAADPPVETLPNDQVLALARSQIIERRQEELSTLLARKAEGLLNAADRVNLDELMNIFRYGLVRKAQALHVAVARELISPLD